MQIVSFSPFGYEGALVTVEVDLRRGIPAIDLVGLADNAVRESRERMRAAIRNSGFEFPMERVLISLSPADVKKEGAGFDLAIALALLAIQNSQKKTDSATVLPHIGVQNVLVLGELELSGKVRPVRGVNAAASTAVENGICYCIVPKENETEACVNGMEAKSVSSLKEAFHALFSFNIPANTDFQKNSGLKDENAYHVEFETISPEKEFAFVKNQPFLVRALQIAAAGKHNVLVYGPPGCGKTLALQRFNSLLPLLSEKESQTTARILSLAGIIQQKEERLRPPFRAPHQSASLEGIIGGGVNCRPGEISLAHNGVLFLDEAAEFRTNVLQALRIPLETGKITLSRAGRHTVFPADFQLLLATNPCQCGNFGSPNKICVCSAHSIEQYWKKLSSPLLDRIDIRLALFSHIPGKKIKKTQSTQELRTAIARAVLKQKKRAEKSNSRLTPEETARFCILTKGAQELLENTILQNGFSARGVDSCLKIARTIADMSDSEYIAEVHMNEAIMLRKNEGGINGCF